jgi:hypothetical protein
MTQNLLDFVVGAEMDEGNDLRLAATQSTIGGVPIC